jgi:hypothetical protein
MSDLKTSLLINRQVPEFIREENPLFIAFLEAYYEFLEQKQGDELNDLIKRSKDLRNLPDVDESIEDFQDSFFNMFATNVPQDVKVDKAFLIKNLLPLYLSKGSEKSFKLLFRMLFGQELEVSYPRNDVLRASDGKWVAEKFVKITPELSVLHTGDGNTKTFDLLPCRCPIAATPIPFSGTVFVNGTEVTTGFTIRKEVLKIVFDVAPQIGDNIEVIVRNADPQVLIGRQLRGVTSGATALIQRIGGQIQTNRPLIELYIDEPTLLGRFGIGEDLESDAFSSEGTLYRIKLRGSSRITEVNIIDGGSNYRVGDPVIINAPVAEFVPKAVINKVFAGKINRIIVENGGAGFQVPGDITAEGFTEEELFFAISEIQTERANSVTDTYFIYSDLISDIDPENTTLDTTDWNFPGNIAPSGVINLESTISNAFSNTKYTSLGSISDVAIIVSNVVVNRTPNLNAEPAKIFLDGETSNTTAQSSITIDTFGSIGKLRILNGGQNYRVGDELIFTNPKNKMAIGIGAEAEVSNTTSAGVITEVLLLPPKITGTANVFSASNTSVQGNNTLFLTELVPGDLIMIRTANTGFEAFETKKVVDIIDDNNLVVNTPFQFTFTFDQPIRKIGKYPVGGQGYTTRTLPLVSVSTTTGTDAVIEVDCIMGDGEDLLGLGTRRPGEIEEISIIDPGSRIRVIPQVDLSGFGDGTAIANVTLSPTYDSLAGRWTSSDGILSSLDRKLQGKNYYVNYSYLTSSFVEFSKYKKIFKELLHPSGFRAYAEWKTFNILNQDSSSLDTLVLPTNVRTLSGLVSTSNGSIYVTGSNTKFEVANSKGIISVGSYIAINSEIRVVDSIISNTNLSVTEAFTIDVDKEPMVVINTAYNAIATETTLDEIVAENNLVLTVQE